MHLHCNSSNVHYDINQVQRVQCMSCIGHRHNKNSNSLKENIQLTKTQISTFMWLSRTVITNTFAVLFQVLNAEKCCTETHKLQAFFARVFPVIVVKAQSVCVCVSLVKTYSLGSTDMSATREGRSSENGTTCGSIQYERIYYEARSF